ncbi:hypothetical protein CK203_078278 [Vitis vinifera]|uniref:Uncharacterized protein n=1 Tax=Vitis vinifera TaxID=29760 RepID=A0A438DKR5_VITVI|nr:hypothetical protein CK203_078278 [Vitis vinifera]
MEGAAHADTTPQPTNTKYYSLYPYIAFCLFNFVSFNGSVTTGESSDEHAIDIEVWYGDKASNIEKERTPCESRLPRIPKVPDTLRNSQNIRLLPWIQPSVVSIGPYYYNKNLRKAQKLKSVHAEKFIRKDLFLLENQLPYEVLELLLKDAENSIPMKGKINDFVASHVPFPRGISVEEDNQQPCQPCHLLHYLQAFESSNTSETTTNNVGIISYLCFLDSLIDRWDDVKELQAAGILRLTLTAFRLTLQSSPNSPKTQALFPGILSLPTPPRLVYIPALLKIDCFSFHFLPSPRNSSCSCQGPIRRVGSEASSRACTQAYTLALRGLELVTIGEQTQGLTN